MKIYSQAFLKCLRLLKKNPHTHIQIRLYRSSKRRKNKRCFFHKYTTIYLWNEWQLFIIISLSQFCYVILKVKWRNDNKTNIFLSVVIVKNLSYYWKKTGLECWCWLKITNKVPESVHSRLADAVKTFFWSWAKNKHHKHETSSHTTATSILWAKTWLSMTGERPRYKLKIWKVFYLYTQH